MRTERMIEVHVDERGCARAKVSASMLGAGGREKLDLAVLVNACQQAGIAVTDDVRAELADLLEEICAVSRANESELDEPGDIERIIARPTRPIDGEDGFIEWCEGYDPTLKLTSFVEGDRVDHYAGRTFIQVESGTHVGTFHAPTPGTDGVDVFGKPIRATPGKPCPYAIDTSVNVTCEGRMSAQREGVITVKDKTVLITKLLEISEHVDFSTGNIDFDGCVDIREDVRDLFQINANGSVSVGGLIESATITCGGDFTGHRGMVGRGRGSLTVKGDAEIGFLNTSNCTIGGTLSVRREIIDCEILIQGGIEAEACSLIGGRLELHGKGVIGTIGSPSDRPTHVVLTPGANLVVTKLIHPKVTIQIGRRTYQITRETKGPVRIVAAGDNELAYRVADGSPRPLEEISRIVAAAA